MSNTEVVKIDKETLQNLTGISSAEELPHLKYDLGNMAIFSTINVDYTQVKDDTIVDELAREHVQHLFSKLFNLPTEPAPQESGRLAQLPEPTFHLPRAKPIPVQKPMTKWEKFAKEKGIVKRPRGGKVYDEESETWKKRFGKDRANDKSKQWAMEVKENGDDASADPWLEMRRAKKERVEKNKQQQLANIRAAQTGHRSAIPGAIDLASVLAPKAPVKRNAQGKAISKDNHLDIALKIAQKSTNSMGKFDKLRKGEEIARPAKKPRRDAELQNIHEEHKQHAAVLKKVLGRVSEAESLNVDRAAASIGASSIKSGEIVTAQSVLDKRKGKAKVAKVRAQAKRGKPTTALKGKGKSKGKGSR